MDIDSLKFKGELYKWLLIVGKRNKKNIVCLLENILIMEKGRIGLNAGKSVACAKRGKWNIYARVKP